MNTFLTHQAKNQHLLPKQYDAGALAVIGVKYQ